MKEVTNVLQVIEEKKRAREEDVLLKYCQHPMYKAGNWRMIKDHDRVNGNHLFDRSIVSED